MARAKSLREWLETDVRPVQDEPLSWLSAQHFFRDPPRPAYSDLSYFFAPADGILLYQGEVDSGAPILDIKGRHYSLQEAMRDRHFDRTCLVIGIFMTFYDVHVNRVPYPGRLTYRKLEPIHTHNRPMLEVEKAILKELRVPLERAEYLHDNERVLNRIWSDELGDAYYVLQIADYDVDSITPFELNQNQPVSQGHRFSQIRYGSQVDLIIPLSSRFDFETTQPTRVHVEGGIDPVVRIHPKEPTNRQRREASANA
jgi:phosphatidylserine decarboxylase